MASAVRRRAALWLLLIRTLALWRVRSRLLRLLRQQRLDLLRRELAPSSERQLAEPRPSGPEAEDVETYGLLKNLTLLLVAIWLGSGLGAAFTALGLTLPSYIGAMLFAAALRNLDDATGWIGISQRTIDDLGGSALALFLVMALMTLELASLVGLAVPLAVLVLSRRP